MFLYSTHNRRTVEHYLQNYSLYRSQLTYCHFHIHISISYSISIYVQHFTAVRRHSPSNSSNTTLRTCSRNCWAASLRRAATATAGWRIFGVSRAATGPYAQTARSGCATVRGVAPPSTLDMTEVSTMWLLMPQPL